MPLTASLYIFAWVLGGHIQGCRQNFQQMGIISSQAGLGESIIKDFKDCRRFLSRLLSTSLAYRKEGAYILGG